LIQTSRAEQLKLVKDEECEFDLSGCLGPIVIDQPDNIRNLHTQITTTILTLALLTRRFIEATSTNSPSSKIEPQRSISLSIAMA
jgi:hypothetical protein